MGDEKKTPSQRAEEEVSKRLGKAIASRLLEIKRHQAEIKKLEKEIRKIENGELVPDEEDEFPPTHKCKEKVVEKHYPYVPYPFTPTPVKNPYRPQYWYTSSIRNGKSTCTNGLFRDFSTSINSTDTLFPKRK